MPNNLSPDDLNTMYERLSQRVTRIENSPQLGFSAIQQGGIEILDANGNVVMIVGYQPDGSLGLASYDPNTGTKMLQIGQEAGSSLFGLSVLNTITGVFQQVAGTVAAPAGAAQTTHSTTNVTFPDDPVVDVVVGSSGQALVTYGAYIGTGGDNDGGFCSLTVDGSPWAGVEVSCGGAGVGMASSPSMTTLVFGLSPGSHRFSLTYNCATGVHGVTFANRFVVVSPF